MIKNKHYQPLILFGLFWAFSITLLRALKWPAGWAEVHWLISYEFGFIKRALPGTLIAPLINSGNINGYADLVIKITSTSFLLLFCAGLFRICVRIIEKSRFNINSVLVALVFLTSPYIVMSADLNGYFDNIIIIIAVFACLLVMRGKIWSGSIIASIGMLIHETTLLVGLPSIIFFAFVRHIKETEDLPLTRLFIAFFARYGLPFFIPVLTFSLIVINHAVFLEPAIVNQLVSHLSQFDFLQRVENESYLTVLAISFFDHLHSQSPTFFYRITDQIHVTHIGPPLFVLLSFCWYNLRMVVFNRLIFSALVAITLLPLSLHAIAWDTSRIWTYPLVVAMLSLWGISEIFPAVVTKERDSLFFCIIAIMVIVFQLFILTPLTSDMQERYSNEERILLYAPSLILVAMFASKYYCLTRRSS